MLEQMKNSVSKGVAAVSIKSGEFVEVSKLKTQISKLEAENELKKRELGAGYYNCWKNNYIDEAVIQQLCEEMQERELEVEQLITKIEELQTANNDMLSTPQSSATGIACTCGRVNPVGAKFCSSCGKLLTILAAEEKNCQCGASVPKTAKFCTLCGTPFAESK